MGSSHHLQISKIVGLLMLLQPGSVLDIGTGFGKYGVLSREYLGDGGRTKDFIVDGIEGHADNVTSLHKSVYNNIYIGDVFKLIDSLGKSYDLVLLIDVLEHFDKDRGREIIHKILSKHGGIIISTPKYVGVQEDEHNPYQEHKSQWSRSDLGSFGPCFFVGDPISHVVYIGKAEMIASLRKNYFKQSLRYSLGQIGPINALYRKLWWNKRKAIRKS